MHDNDEEEEHLEPSLHHPLPDYFPDSFLPPPPQPTPLPHPHLYPDYISANYSHEDDDNDGVCMLRNFPWNLPSYDDREYRFGELDRIDECCSASMISSLPSTYISFSAHTEGLVEELPDAEKSDDKPPSLEMA